MEQKYTLDVKCYDNAYSGIEAIKNAEIYLPIFIITSVSIYPEFYEFLKLQLLILKIFLFKLFLLVVLNLFEKA